MTSDVLPYVAATAVLFAVSGALAVAVAAVLAGAAQSARRPARWAGALATTVTRGVPTSLLVVTAGIVAFRYPAPGWLPNPFPATPDGMHLVAWAVVAALALGSAGHLAVIFRTAYLALGRFRIEQIRAMAFGPVRQARVVTRETAPTALAPTGARLVHHLHNTAFAALFPVADLFGWVQQQANATFDVTRYVLIGAALYVAMGAVIWAVFRALEALLVPARPGSATGRRVAEPVDVAG